MTAIERKQTSLVVSRFGYITVDIAMTFTYCTKVSKIGIDTQLCAS